MVTLASAPSSSFSASQRQERKRDKMRHSMVDIALVAWEHCTRKNLLPLACYVCLVGSVLAFCTWIEFDLFKFLIKKRYRNAIYMWAVHVFIAIITCKYYYNERVRDVLKRWMVKCVILKRKERQSFFYYSTTSRRTVATQCSLLSPEEESRNGSKDDSAGATDDAEAESSPSSSGSQRSRAGSDDEVKMEAFAGLEPSEEERSIVRTNFFAAMGIYAVVFVAHVLSLVMCLLLTFTLVPVYSLVKDTVDFFYAIGARFSLAFSSKREEPQASLVHDTGIKTEGDSATVGSDEQQVACDFPAQVKSIWMTEENKRLLKAQNPRLGQERLKILLICEYAPCEFHGMAVRLKNCVRELSKDHDVRIMTSRNKEQLQKEGFNDVHTIDLYRQMGYCVQNLWNPGNKLWYAPNLNLVENFFDFQPDVVHVFYPCIVTLPVFALSYLLDVPVYCSHHVDMTYYIGKYWKSALCRRMCYFWYTLHARLPAYLLGDINVAPTKNALDKEFEVLYANSFLRKCVQLYESFGCLSFPDDSPVYADLQRQHLAQQREEELQLAAEEEYAQQFDFVNTLEMDSNYPPLPPSSARSFELTACDSPCTTASHRSDSDGEEEELPEVSLDEFRQMTKCTTTTSTTASPAPSSSAQILSNNSFSKSSSGASSSCGSADGSPQVSRRTTTKDHELLRDSPQILNLSPNKIDKLSFGEKLRASARNFTPEYLQKYMLQRGLEGSNDTGSSCCAVEQMNPPNPSGSAIRKSVSLDSLEDRMTASTYSGMSEDLTSSRMTVETSSRRASGNNFLPGGSKLQAGPSFDFSDFIIPTSVGSSFRGSDAGAVAGNATAAKTPVLAETSQNLIRGNIPMHKDAKIILMVQRVAPEKRVEMALRQMPKLVGKFHLVVVGDGPAFQHCVDVTTKLYQCGEKNILQKNFLFQDNDEKKTKVSHDQSHLSKDINVTFLGMVANARLPVLYQNADFFLSCAVSETFGITVIEALSCNLVPLLARCQVFEELYRDSKFITDCMFNTEQELLDTLTRLADRKERIPSGEELRFQLRNSIFFSWDQAAKTLVSQYRQCQKVRAAFT
ncbi:unnamed protein product [Amoebophrya sp. A120]|nr:unnamed protein product [Amoebophrya sp. A120]|eukprot:GSA120T00004851001.1